MSIWASRSATSSSREVHDALMENLVIFFRDQKMSIEQHKEFGRRFGPLHTHPNAPITFPEHPEILVIKADENSKRVAGEEWHTDVSCDIEPPMGSIPYLTEVPPEGGGDTLFANMYRAYDTLSAPIKEMLKGLTALHDSSKAHYYRVKATDRDDIKFPNAEHPIVRTHPVTGRQGPLRQSRLHLAHPATRASTRATRCWNALPPHRDAGVPVPLQVAAQLRWPLPGQSLRPAPRHVRLLPAPPVRPQGHGQRRQSRSCGFRA